MNAAERSHQLSFLFFIVEWELYYFDRIKKELILAIRMPTFNPHKYLGLRDVGRGEEGADATLPMYLL